MKVMETFASLNTCHLVLLLGKEWKKEEREEKGKEGNGRKGNERNGKVRKR